jgi:hypothetical protein
LGKNKGSVMARTVAALAAHLRYFHRFAGPRTRHILLATAAFSVLAAAATAFSLSGSDVDVATAGGAQTSCAEQTWPYIEPRCLKGGNRQVRHVTQSTLASTPPTDPPAQTKLAKRASPTYSDEIDAAPVRAKRTHARSRAPGQVNSRIEPYPFMPRGRDVW